MTVKIKILQYVIFVELQKFDTADIKCFTIPRSPGSSGGKALAY